MKKQNVSTSPSSPCPSASPPSHATPLPDDGTAGGKKKLSSGRKKFRETRHPIYHGVRQRGPKWVSEIRPPKPHSRIWLGTFPTPEMAAAAYDAAAVALKGPSTQLNFPSATTSLPRPSSLSIADVQTASREAAAQVGVVDDGAGGDDSATYDNIVGSLTSSDLSEPSRSKDVFVMDEEEAFNLPGLLDSMAEGLILTPPALKRGHQWDDEEGASDWTLWGE